MTYVADDDWTNWSDSTNGATVTVNNGVLRVQSTSADTYGLKRLTFWARGGDKVLIRVTARALSGQGRIYSDFGSQGGPAAGDVIITDKEFRAYSLEYVVPHTYNVIAVYAGFGCSSADIGDVEGFAPCVYLNGTQINTPSLPTPQNIDVNSGNPALHIKQAGSGLALLVEGMILFGQNLADGGGNTATGIAPRYQFLGTNTNACAVALYNFENRSAGNSLLFFKSRGTAGNQGAVSNGDVVANIHFQASDGTSFIRPARINCSIDGTPGTNSMPGRLTFDTTASGAATPTERLRITSDGVVRPGADNTQSFGEASFRWSQIFAGTGTINTSDEREKQDIAELDAAEKRVALAIKGLVRKYRFKDAVKAKGEAARIHVGVIAQDVIAAFQAEGLDATRYGIVCFDEWQEMPEEIDDEGNVVQHYRPAGNRYGIRYEELLAFLIAAL